MYIDKNSCFPGIVPTDGSCFRYVDKDVIGNEEYLYSNYYREQIAQYGTQITYYVNQYNVLSADNFYGEDPTRKYAQGVVLNAYVELSENANTLTKFGFQADDEITIFIHLSAFYDYFINTGIQPIQTETNTEQVVSNESSIGLRDEVPSTYEAQFNQVQPKSGDVFVLTEYGK